MIKSISIIFPIFNESNRLKYCFEDIKKFNHSSNIKEIQYIFVDDGSKDNSYYIINEFIKKNKRKYNKITYKIVRLITNGGKGIALKNGVKIATKDWILTVDTDISVSLLEINKWIKNKYLKKNNEIFFASRNLKKSIVKFEYHRKLVGLIFIIICRLFLKINLSDTQCGFKLYKKNIAKKIFVRLKEKKFAHDIEVVLLAKKLNNEIIELPIKWVHKNDSKINLIKDSINMFFALIKIKKNLVDNR